MATFRTLGGEVVVTMNPVEVKRFLGSEGGPVARHMLVDGEKVRQRALELVPRRTGNLAAHIVKRLVRIGDDIGCIVGVDGGQVRYAYWVHEGVPPHNYTLRSRAVFMGREGKLVVLPAGTFIRHPGQKPNRFLARAIEAIRG